MTDYLTMSGVERGVEAIKLCHRAVRANLLDGLNGDEASLARTKMALDLLAILRPEMTPEAILAAALRRIEEGS